MKTTLVELTTGARELPLPIRFVSDWHLGHPGSQLQSIDQVEHLLAEVGTLVMVGDGREELVNGWRARADELWQNLQALCQERGVEFLALTGNHDPNASEEGWMKLADGRILATHGDMIYDTASPWSKELFANRKAVEDVLASHSCSCLKERWLCAREVGILLRPDAKMAPNFWGYLKLAFWPPERLLEIGKVWGQFPREGVRFLERFSPETKTLICGHFHRAGRFRHGEREVWNTGSLMKLSKGFVIDFDGAELVSRPIALQ